MKSPLLAGCVGRRQTYIVAFLDRALDSGYGYDSTGRVPASDVSQNAISSEGNMNTSANLLRFTNGSILGVIVLLTQTGLYGLVWPMPGWMFDLHRGAAWALFALAPWKALIAWRSLRRGLERRFQRSVVVPASLLMAVWVLAVFFLALYWGWYAGPERVWWYQTAVSWHWYLALGLWIPLLFHLWQRWPRPRRADFVSRRSALKLLAVGGSATALWLASRRLAGQRADPARPESPTGSREIGSFSGLGYPINMMVGEGRTPIEIDSWRLALSGAVLRPRSWTYGQIKVIGRQEQIATLDCTDGWYTTQVWGGVPLARLLQDAGVQEAALGFALRAVSGYAAYFILPEADEILLATHAGGQVFDHGHGFPLRAVVPSRRGWQWVKWLVEIEVF